LHESSVSAALHPSGLSYGECIDMHNEVFLIKFDVTQLVLVGYCIIFGNLGRFDKVLDDCKNFCGQLNDDNPFDCGVSMSLFLWTSLLLEQVNSVLGYPN
jgi:hypothetical protein